MAEPKNPREPRIPKETAPFDADNKWTRTWIMYFESLFTLSVKEAVRQTLEVAVTHTDDLTKDLPVFGNDAADIKVGTKSGNTTKLVTNIGTNVTGNTVKWDASGNLIDAGTTPGGGGGGSGTVTSVALTVPAEFSVAGSPVTTSGTLAVSKATQTANTVYAGPTTGSAAAPTFRAMVPADLPGGGGGLVLLEQHTASSSAALNFTTAITSTYDEYVIDYLNVLPATDNVTFRLQVSTDGGATYDTANNYKYAAWAVNSAAGTGAVSSAAAPGVYLSDAMSNASANGGVSGRCIFYAPGSALHKKMTTQSAWYVTGPGNWISITGSGVYASTTAVNAFRVIMSSGNIASGTVRVYGLAK